MNKETKINLKVKTGDEVLSIKKVISEELAREILRLVLEDSKQTDYQKKQEETEQKKSNRKYIRNKESLYQKMLTYMEQHKEGVSANQIYESIKIEKNTIYAYFNFMVARGIIYKKQKGIYAWKDESNEEVEKRQENTFELEEKDILEYIFNKTKFTMEKINDKFYSKRKEITDIIKEANKYELIIFDEEKEEYKVPVTSKLWYYLLKNNRKIGKNKIMCDLRFSESTFEQVKKEAVEKGLIETKMVERLRCYEAKLKLFVKTEE